MNNSTISSIHTFKTGGTFVHFCLDELFNLSIARIPHLPLSMHSTEGILISTARNPFDWYVSVYHYCLDRNIPLGTGFDGFSSFLKCMLSFRGSQKHKELVEIGWSSLSTLGITEEALSCPPEDMGGVCSWTFSSMTDNFREDVKFMRFENLTEDFIRVLKDYTTLTEEQEGRIRNAPVINTTKRKPYQEYYTDDLVSLVYEKDKVMFDRFNYEF